MKGEERERDMKVSVWYIESSIVGREILLEGKRDMLRHQGGVTGCLGPKPLGPNTDGMGLRRALPAGILGTPWMTRGSFIRVGSNLAGTARLLGIETS